MSANNRRLLETGAIPETLWDRGTQTLILPTSLAEAYGTLIDRRGLREIATNRSPDDSPVGGITEDATNEHFAKAFDGSYARVQLAILDPKCDAIASSNAFLRSLAGNHVVVVDAPCGAGAAFLAFVCTVAELRSREALPRQPLNIKLIGAERSAFARQLSQEMLDGLQSFLEEQAIFIDGSFRDWDVTDAMSNTGLIQEITRASPDHGRRLLVVANFSGFLQRERRRKDAEPQLGELFRHASGSKSTAVWIEPQTNEAISDGGILHWLIAKASSAWRQFCSREVELDNPDPIPVSSAPFRLPLASERTVMARLAVVPLNLFQAP
jgi:hypothetical protein